MRFEKWQRRPVDVEAIQYQGFTIDCLKYDVRVKFDDNNSEATVKTLEGEEVAKFGDYIVRGPMGELEVMKPEVFENTHDRCDNCPRPRTRKQKTEEPVDVFESQEGDCK